VAARPRSLWVALAPVLVGAALGWRRSGALDGWAAAAALVAALLMQLITNLQNDVGFTRRGAHRVAGRIGLPRATALGWLSARQVQAMVGLLAALATGSACCWCGGRAGPCCGWARPRCWRRWPIWAGPGRSPTPRWAS
jgi:1,4-dihydroxy-2-naphthoate octaprenyltransferase